MLNIDIMKQPAYGKPLFLSSQGEGLPLHKVAPLDELSLQSLIYQHPECLPISDIDEGYNPVVSVCKELTTPTGAIDILLASPNGELTIVETKLWRNPEARRVVVAQILDYASQMSNWGYEDLQREVNKKLGTKHNAFYELVKKAYPDLTPPEPDFIDSVSRNLSRGKFLLLIAGDGIREGAKGIADFLSTVGHLNFTLAMVEMSMYRAEGLGTLVIPRTLVKTVEISKVTVELPAGYRAAAPVLSAAKPTDAISPEKEIEREFYTQFWKELVTELTFDDPGQPLPNPAYAQNLYVYPASTRKAWISAYFMKSNKRVGVYFRVQNDQEGQAIVAALDSEKEQIREELGNEVLWTWSDSGDVGVRLLCDDIFAPENREELKDFFKTWLNTFVNVFRPRLKRGGF